LRIVELGNQQIQNPITITISDLVSLISSTLIDSGRFDAVVRFATIVDDDRFNAMDDESDVICSMAGDVLFPATGNGDVSFDLIDTPFEDGGG